MSEIIRLENVEKVYGKQMKTKVIEGLNLVIEEGSFTSIIGQSGSGKSTLLNMIGTLDRPTDGKVIINGKETRKMSKRNLARLRNESIGFVFQFHYLLPEFSALENVLMPAYIKHDHMAKKAQQRAYELLELVGLKGFEHKRANNLSGGQQQRVAIARALMNEPKIILADEPTGNLDSVSTEQIYELLREINVKTKTTFVIITHDKRVAEKADRIIEISDGKIVMDIIR